MSNYVFEGEVIKLNAKDYYRFAGMFKFLNLTEELEILDLELECKRRDGLSTKSWFSSLVPRLNGRNKRAQSQAQWRGNKPTHQERERQIDAWINQGASIGRQQ